MDVSLKPGTAVWVEDARYQYIRSAVIVDDTPPGGGVEVRWFCGPSNIPAGTIVDTKQLTLGNSPGSDTPVKAPATATTATSTTKSRSAEQSSDSAVDTLSRTTEIVAVTAVRPMTAQEVEGVDDMITMPALHDGSILHCLRARYARDLIYTYVGTILVTINPYKTLSLFDAAEAKRYRAMPLGSLPPHIFATADRCHSLMIQTRRDQCFVISGDSGSGKTEATKVILQYLSGLASGKTSGSVQSTIKERIIECSPILEAFGNACTLRNRNSSRFGKYTQIQFSLDGAIEGGRIGEFLLEKSRIVHQELNERNYHAFYTLLDGAPAEMREKLGLVGTSANYYYTNQGMASAATGAKTAAATSPVGAPVNKDADMADETNNFDRLRAVAIVLHLGNISFVARGDGAAVADDTSLKSAAALMELPVETLRKVLICKTSNVRGETMVTPLNVSQCTDSRDTLSKAIYSFVFGWLVRSLNSRIASPQTGQSIGILDIFGFESFKVNSFEQLLINYANERLQQFFNRHVFLLEQEYYRNEGIKWTNIEFVDNQPCIDMIAKRPNGILRLLDDESQLPKATDMSFAGKVRKTQETNAKNADKHAITSTLFIVNHFAGRVVYTADGFLDKNRDLLRTDLENIFTVSGFQFLGELLKSTQVEQVAKRQAAATSKTSAPLKTDVKGKNVHALDSPVTDANLLMAATATSASAAGPAGPTKSRTVASKFDESLSELMNVLFSCTPHFIRCIKPNYIKVSRNFDDGAVMEQLRNIGLLQTVFVRKAGYSTRMTHADFIGRYRVLCGQYCREGVPDRDVIVRFLANLEPFKTEKTLWDIGPDSVFYKESVSAYLEQSRTVLVSRYAVAIQACFRRFSAQQMYFRARKTYQRNKQERREKSATRIQAFYRMFVARRAYRAKLVKIRAVQHLLRVRIAQAFVVHRLEEKKRIANASIARPKSAQPKSSGPGKLSQIRPRSVVVNANVEDLMQKLESVFSGEDEFSTPIVVDLGSLLNWSRFIFEPTSATAVTGPLDPSCEFGKYVQAYFVMPHCEYSTKPILNPLTHVPESLHDTALLAFLCIMIIADGFPIDKSTVPPLNRLIYILRMGLMNEELRDELYCQLCMQINMNSKESLPAYWRLMTIYMQYFPPSRTFEKFLMDFCSKHAPADKRGRLVAMLMTSIERGPRRNVPTLAEIVSLLKGEKKTVVVKLADDSRLPFVIGPFTTWGDVLSLAMGSFRASSYSGWAFFGEGRLHSLNLGHHVLDSDPACTGKMFTSGLAELPKTVTLRKELMEPAEPIKETRLVELIWAQVMAHVKTTALRCPQALAAQFAAPLAKIHDKQPSEAFELLRKHTSVAFTRDLSATEFGTQVQSVATELVSTDAISWKRACIQSLVNLPGLFGKKFITQSVKLPKDTEEQSATVIVDTTGIHVLSGAKEELLLSVLYEDFKEIAVTPTVTSLTNQTGQIVRLGMHGAMATQMHGFIDRNYRRLCELSRWARCKKSYTALTSEQLSMSVGDVIEIRDREKANWWLGVNLSVAAHPEGWFPSDAVSVLPRLSQTPPEVFTDTSAAKNFTEYTPIPVTMLAGDESRTTLMSQLKTVLNPSNAGDVSSTIDSISSGAESKNIPQPRVSKKAAADHRKSIAQSTISESDPLHSDLASTTSSETKNKPAKLRRRSLLITSANGSVRTSVLGTMEGVSQTCDPLTSAQPEFIEALYQWAETQLRLSESSALGRFTGKEANTTPEMLQVRIRERLAYSKAPIKYALSKLSGQEERLSMEVYMNILRYCGDYPTKLKDADLALDVINAGLLNSTKIRTEIYLQLMKQQIMCDNPASLEKGWGLALLVSYFFPPETSFVAVCNKWTQLRQISQPQISDRQAVIEQNLVVALRHGARKYIATKEEITHLEIGSPLVLNVVFSDRSSMPIAVRPNTTVVTVMTDALTKNNIPAENVSAYSLFNVTDAGVFILDPGTYVMDALLYMENNGLKDKNVAVRTLAVRRRIWPSVLPRVYTSEVAMMLHELHALFADGWLHNGPGVTNKLLDIIMPLRVKMMEIAGQAAVPAPDHDVAATDASQPTDDTDATSLQPVTVLNNESSLVDEIAGMCKQANMPDDLRVSAQLSVFDALMQSPSYGVSVPYYLTGVKCNKIDFPSKVVLLVALKGILLVNPGDKEIIAGWMYSELVGWSLATNRIIFKIGSLLQQQQIVLKVTTTQGQTISDVMDVYTKLQQQQTTEK